MIHCARKFSDFSASLLLHSQSVLQFVCVVTAAATLWQKLFLSLLLLILMAQHLHPESAQRTAHWPFAAQ